LSQERVSVRVLVIDDASSDDTPIVGTALADNPRVEFRRHAVNMRHIATYNEGLLEWATARYSLLLSADDWLAPGALARAVDFLEEHPEVGFVCGYAMIVEDQPPAGSIPKLDGKRCILSGDQYTHMCMTAGNPVSTPTAVVRTELQQMIGGYNAELPHSGDMEMWLRFAVHASVGIIRDLQAFYRWHGANMGREYYNRTLGDLQEQAAACDAPLRLWPEQRRVTWTETLHRRLADAAFWAAHRALDAGDAAGASMCLQYAVEHDTTLVPSIKWLKLQIKRALGAKSWVTMKPFADRLRGVAPPPSQGEYFRVGKLTGWRPPEDSFWRNSEFSHV
jgi:glycosyltransferase involved in cell wall biosynthesis